MKILMSLASLVVSGTFTWASLAVTDAEGWARAVDWGMLLYGVATTVLLALAWLRPNGALVAISAVTAAAFFLLLVVGSFDSGMISGLESVFLAALGVGLSVNWFGVKTVCGPHRRVA